MSKNKAAEGISYFPSNFPSTEAQNLTCGYFGSILCVGVTRDSNFKFSNLTGVGITTFKTGLKCRSQFPMCGRWWVTVPVGPCHCVFLWVHSVIMSRLFQDNWSLVIKFGFSLPQNYVSLHQLLTFSPHLPPCWPPDSPSTEGTLAGATKLSFVLSL